MPLPPIGEEIFSQIIQRKVQDGEITVLETDSDGNPTKITNTIKGQITLEKHLREIASLKIAGWLTPENCD